MLSEPLNSHAAGEVRTSKTSRLIGFLCALLVTALIFAGYAYMRKRHVQQTLATLSKPENVEEISKGPPKAEILVDEPLLKGGETIIGGTVKNVSGERLGGLMVQLELRRRKDGQIEETSIPLEPPQLETNEEGNYLLKVPAQKYASVRLTGLKGDPKSTRVAYSAGQGKRRPAERLEPKTIVVTKRSGKGDGFLNSPDNPVRVP